MKNYLQIYRRALIRCMFTLATFGLALNSQAQNFGYFASAVHLKKGASDLYYNSSPSTITPNSINPNPGAPFFTGFQGSYVANGGGYVFTIGEVKTFKGSGANVCGASLHYRIYPTGDTPPAFIEESLPFLSNCSGTVFPDLGAGPCGPGDQKWNNFSKDIDLTQRCPGDYTFDVFYTVQGHESGGSCASPTIVYDSNNGANYSTTFTVTSDLQTAASSNSAVCEGSGLNLMANATGQATPLVYEWTNPASSVFSSVANPTISGATTADGGSYQVNVTDACGTVRSSSTSVTVNPLPMAAASSNSPGCEGGMIALMAADAGAGATYSWTGPDGFSSSSKDPAPFASTAATTGDYVVTVTSAAGCVSQSTTMVSCSALPVRLVRFEGEAQESAISLTWQAVEATQFSHFDVERSADARSFHNLGSVKLTSGQEWYQYSDLTPLPNVNYYRLKMVDQDGTFAYSRSIAVKQGELQGHYAYLENPAQTGEIHLFTNIEPSSIVLVDLNRVEKSLKFKRVTEREWIVDLTNVPYNQLSLIKINGSEGSIVRKLLRVR